MKTSPDIDSLEETSPSPAVHSAHIRRELNDLVEHLEADLERVEDPCFQTLLSTSATMLRAITTAFAAYDEEQVGRRHLHE